MDTLSVHGFNSGLNSIDADSRKLWAFLTSAERPPACIIRFFLHTLARESKVGVLPRSIANLTEPMTP
eukprot:12197616-Ditylum_brightwellii.AAC.1